VAVTRMLVMVVGRRGAGCGACEWLYAAAADRAGSVGERVRGRRAWAVVWVLVFGAVGWPWLWAGERERGVVGGVEDLEVREAVGQAHDRLAGGAHDPRGDAEEQVP
jgi:hypothetical protein